jgi:arsenate reductase/amino-acid N-acetyltransferase
MPDLTLEQIGITQELRGALAAQGLLVEDLDGPNRSYFSAVGANGRAVGFSGVEQCDEESVLLRSVVILPEFRSQGHGRRLVELTLATTNPAAEVYLATTGAANFFASVGFARIERAAAPTAILSTRQLSGLCPASATIMRLNRPPT